MAIITTALPSVPVPRTGIRTKNFLSLRTRQAFFDRAKAMRLVDEATRRNLIRAGAFIRRTARQSIRPSKKISLPGNPPHSHVGTLKRGIVFVFDSFSRSVVVGPEPFRLPNRVLPLLEFGGRSLRSGKARSRRGSRRIAKYRARPFMRPAYEKNRAVVTDVWKNSVRRN